MKALAVYDKIDYIEVAPDASLGRLGGAIAAKQFTQLEAIAYSAGPDGKKDTDDDVPLGDWLRGPLRDWAETLLSEKRLAATDFLDGRIIRRYWTEHLSGKRNWQYLLWDVLMFEAWRERWG